MEYFHEGKLICKLMGWMICGVLIFWHQVAISDPNVPRWPLVDGYGNCTWHESGNKVIASVLITYKAYPDGILWLKSRGLMIWAYDKDGNSHAMPVSFYANVTMDGVAYQDMRRNVFVESSNGTVLFGNGGDWINKSAFTADVAVIFQKSEWRAISVMAANIDTTQSSTGAEAEVTGAAYIYPDSQGSGCEVVSPIHPPKPPVTIRMSAPDWDLGELPVDHGEKKFTDVADQLCFSYSGLSGDGVNVVVDADSKNGVIDNQYQLKDLSDSTQTVPYSVVLDDGVTEFALPNRNKSQIKLNSSGRTCLTPIFKTYVRPMLKKGSYSDVLTFTVVTKA